MAKEPASRPDPNGSTCMYRKCGGRLSVTAGMSPQHFCSSMCAVGFARLHRPAGLFGDDAKWAEEQVGKYDWNSFTKKWMRT